MSQLRYSVAVLCLAIPTMEVSYGQGPDNKSVEEVIRTAWKDRFDKLKGFQCTCALTRVEWNGTDDLFDPKQPGADGSIILHSSFTISMQGAKLSLQSNGDKWNNSKNSTIEQSYARSFDGVTNKALIESESFSFPSAQINNERKPALELTSNTHYIPLWLSFSPGEMLTRLDFDISRMSATEDRTERHEEDLVEIAVPRRDVVAGHVLVDPSLGYLPVQFVEWRGVGKMRSDIEIEYETNEKLGPVVTRWTSRLYDGNGKVETTLSGRVEQISINEPINEKVFDIALPVGTRVRETLDGKTRFYIHGEKEKREVAK